MEGDVLFTSPFTNVKYVIMACCTEYQTECLKVVTIGYLKNFIKNGSTYLIQNSTGGNVDVNMNALAVQNRRDDYCPTYSELNGGVLIQKWVQGSSPNSDQDGIILGGSYATNQVVRQQDLSLKYTRFSSFSISANKTNTSECGDSSVISYAHSYNRNSKYMNSSCSVVYGGNTGVTDTTDSEVTLTTSSFGTFGNWVNHTKTLSIPKNGTISSTTRSTSVCGSVSFRTSAKNSCVTITQNGLSGNWNLHDRVNNSFYVASPNKPDRFDDCNAGVIQYYGVLNYTENYEWLDSCGKHYIPSEKAYSAVTKTDNILNGGNYYTVSYEAVEPDCEADLVADKPVSVSTSFNPVTSSTVTLTANKTFTIVCPADPDQEKCVKYTCAFVYEGSIVYDRINLRGGGRLELQAFGCDGSCMYYSMDTHNPNYKNYVFQLLQTPSDRYEYIENNVKLYKGDVEIISSSKIRISAYRAIFISINRSEFNLYDEGEYRLHYTDLNNGIDCDSYFTLSLSVCDTYLHYDSNRPLPIYQYEDRGGGYFIEDFREIDTYYYQDITATTEAGWIHIEEVIRSYTLTIRYSVDSNYSSNERIGTIRIEGTKIHKTEKSICDAIIIRQDGRD